MATINAIITVNAGHSVYSPRMSQTVATSWENEPITVQDMKSVQLGFYLDKLKPVYDVAQWTENFSVPGRFRFTRVLEILDSPDCGIFLLKTFFSFMPWLCCRGRWRGWWWRSVSQIAHVKKPLTWTHVQYNVIFFLVQDIPLCLSILLKWNKIHTAAKTYLLHFVKLNYIKLTILYYIYIYIQGVPGGMCQTSGGCSLCWSIPI